MSSDEKTSRDHAPAAGFALDAERLLRLRDRQLKTNNAAWLRAAETALAALPGASNSTHPAHALWLRVEMAKQPSMDVVLSSAEQVEGTDPGMTKTAKAEGATP